VQFDYKLEDAKQMVSANLTNLHMQASQFPDVKKTSYKVTLEMALYVSGYELCSRSLEDDLSLS